MKRYPLIAVFAILAGALTCGVLWVLQWLSWWIVFIAAMICLIPVASSAVNLWFDEDCDDLQDFFDAIEERNEDKKEFRELKKQEREENENRISWY
jgi:hypothetical protein